jgi:monoamine oxidase
MNPDLSRRRFIHFVGRAGGAAAAYRTMAAMGLLPAPSAYAGPPALPPGNGTLILILGAGIAGLVAAFELGKAGYDCRILEARARPGGRNWTLRGGDVVEEIDAAQRVAWDVGDQLYFNPGPARLPYHHKGILGYCRELGIPVEVMVNDNRAAYLQDDAVFDGRPQRARAVINDARGFIAELAAKAIDQATLDGPVTTEDKERVRAFLRAFGALDKELAYRGSGRAGYIEPPGAGSEVGKSRPPLDLRQLLLSDFWRSKTQFGEAYTQAATMLQPVGGMGRIGEAFGRRLGGVITYNAEITELRRSGTRARTVWRDRATGAEQAIESEFVLCTLPFSVLRGLAADFAPAVKAAVAALDYNPAAKVAFLANRRFWELDDEIYGGISWTSREITQIWYPSAGFHEPKGILVGAYIWSADLGDAFTAQPPPHRLETALASGERIHRGYRDALGRGVSVAWSKIPFSRGAWAEWSAALRRDAYPLLLQPDGPFYFAGEHMSWITGWQEGAVRSAHYAIAEIANRVQAQR